jgi:uncharacterized OB-fold protein
MAAEYRKPLPPVTATMKPFWDGAKRHELMAYRCLNCGRYYWPAVNCLNCDSPKMAWVAVSGRGEVFTFTIVHQLYHHGWEGEIPYNICWVRLDEGPIMITSISGCKNDEIRIGMRVEAVFDDITGEMTLPRFRPVFDNQP